MMMIMRKMCKISLTKIKLNKSILASALKIKRENKKRSKKKLK